MWSRSFVALFTQLLADHISGTLSGLWMTSSQLTVNTHSTTTALSQVYLCCAGMEWHPCAHWLHALMSNSFFSYACNVHCCFYQLSWVYLTVMCRCVWHKNNTTNSLMAVMLSDLMMVTPDFLTVEYYHVYILDVLLTKYWRIVVIVEAVASWISLVT